MVTHYTYYNILISEENQPQNCLPQVKYAINYELENRPPQ